MLRILMLLAPQFVAGKTPIEKGNGVGKASNISLLHRAAPS
jgi:hypothetical protein